jgi:NADP-dependent 3-hydroxy acid dehydrogenase YdfG
MSRLQGKVALVTGAAAGFGEAIARLFVAEGAKVLLADLDGA